MRTAATASDLSGCRPDGVSLALGFTGALVAVAALHLTSAPHLVGAGAMAAVVAGYSIRATWSAAVGVAVLGWLFLTGFVTNPLGELYVDPSRDGWRLAALVGIALSAAAVGRFVPPRPAREGSHLPRQGVSA